MIITVVVLSVLVALLGGLLLWGLIACVRDNQTDHARCIAHIASITSNKFVADRVRELADDYESIDGAAELTRVRNTLFPGSPAGTALPALWMREQARRIEES